MKLQEAILKNHKYIRRLSWPVTATVENDIYTLSALPAKDIDADDWEVSGRQKLDTIPQLDVNTIDKYNETIRKLQVKAEQKKQMVREFVINFLKD